MLKYTVHLAYACSSVCQYAEKQGARQLCSRNDAKERGMYMEEKEGCAHPARKMLSKEQMSYILELSRPTDTVGSVCLRGSTTGHTSQGESCKLVISITCNIPLRVLELYLPLHLNSL